MRPIVMAFDWISDEHLVTAAAAGSLWMYAPDTLDGSLTLRIWETTGQVVQVVRTPFVDRAVAMATSEGLWLYGGDQGAATRNQCAPRHAGLADGHRDLKPTTRGGGPHTAKQLVPIPLVDTPV